MNTNADRVGSLMALTVLCCTSCATVTEFECELECGTHEQCALADTVAACECVPGYEGEPCAWTGGLRDPDFVDANAWDKTNGATVLPLEETSIPSLGIASFSTPVICSAGSVYQTVEMPNYEDAEPLVVEVRFRNDLARIDVGYNRAFTQLEATFAFPFWNVDRVCLGAAAYGGPVTFQVGVKAPNAQCFIAPVGFFEVDYMRIEPARPGECPAPGEVVNGDARVDGESWTSDLAGGTDPSRPLPEFGIVPGVGEAGTGGVRLRKPLETLEFADRSLATMRTSLSVPLPSEDMPSPALRYWWRASDEWSVKVGLGVYRGAGRTKQIDELDLLVGDAEAQVAEYCLPPWTFGSVLELSFELLWGPLGEVGEVVVDNVEFFSDPRCGTSTELLDPRFDALPFRWPGSDTGVQVTEDLDRESSVQLLEDAERARSAPGLVRLLQGASTTNVALRQRIFVPSPDGDRGPELLFRSFLPSNLPGPTPTWRVGSVSRSFNTDCVQNPEPDESCRMIPLIDKLDLGGGWRTNFVCLPVEWQERWVTVSVGFQGTGLSAYEAYDPPRELLLDDFELRLSERCAPVEP